MSTTISLTYRPKEGLLPELNGFQELIQSIKSVKQYYIGAESAGKENINHYQCWLTCSQRSDNFRKSFITKIMGLVPDDTDMDVSIKVNTVKNQDKDYTLGYCLKEQKDFRTNLLKEVLDGAQKAYQLRQVVNKKSKKEQCSLGVDQIFRMLVQEHENQKEHTFNETIYKNFLRAYSKEISYTTRAKLRIETLQYHINVELEGETISTK